MAGEELEREGEWGGETGAQWPEAGADAHGGEGEWSRAGKVNRVEEEEAERAEEIEQFDSGAQGLRILASLFQITWLFVKAGVFRSDCSVSESLTFSSKCQFFNKKKWEIREFDHLPGTMHCSRNIGIISGRRHLTCKILGLHARPEWFRYHSSVNKGLSCSSKILFRPFTWKLWNFRGFLVTSPSKSDRIHQSTCRKENKMLILRPIRYGGGTCLWVSVSFRVSPVWDLSQCNSKRSLTLHGKDKNDLRPVRVRILTDCTCPAENCECLSRSG
jgi:hypothetical protein